MAHHNPNLAAFNDIQGEIADSVRLIDSIKEDLSNAESCESLGDLHANLDSAIVTVNQLLGELTRLRRDAALALKATP